MRFAIRIQMREMLMRHLSFSHSVHNALYSDLTGRQGEQQKEKAIRHYDLLAAEEKKCSEWSRMPEQASKSGSGSGFATSI